MAGPFSFDIFLGMRYNKLNGYSTGKWVRKNGEKIFNVDIIFFCDHPLYLLISCSFSYINLRCCSFIDWYTCSVNSFFLEADNMLLRHFLSACNFAFYRNAALGG